MKKKWWKKQAKALAAGLIEVQSLVGYDVPDSVKKTLNDFHHKVKKSPVELDQVEKIH